MTTKREVKYARQLDDLDGRRAQGMVSANEYEVRRARLLKEAAKQPLHWGVQLAIIVGILIAFLLVLRIAGALVNAAGS